MLEGLPFLWTGIFGLLDLCESCGHGPSRWVVILADRFEIRLIVIPLSFLRRLDSLKYTSVIALISIGYLVILVFAHFIKGDTMQDRGVIRVVRWESAVATLSSFPVIVFAYTCHQNVGIFGQLLDSSANVNCRCSQFLTRLATTRISEPLPL